MRTKILIPIISAVFLATVVLASCSKKEESPEPISQQQQDPNIPNDPNDPPPPPPPPPADTTDMFTSSGWVTTKVYKNNAEQANHFLIGSSYKFNTPDGYFFSIPNFPSASGTWMFNANTKTKVTLNNQGGTQVWTILSISANAMVIEEPQTNGDVMKFDFTH